ncbi:hypothetical protein LTR16_000018 [Cryomyces antarcticus]|uniref:Uncharacterized protein n=1 Tax=Cryomyces antarcticus TaxID=329879 RepID=A0ABR0KV13_9PEZI|nr:hypothetical protein LTR39_000008 [Cryomyces antarcticus]KAK5021399.1 hypothetical protein LTR60_000015 [Cryomyces antarcticus]KAK5132138.1 hypothetical protein LTR16_000018 [Cryomyces antarcticus]
MSKTETERNSDLGRENTFYRDQLLEFHKKLESLKVSLQNVVDSVAEALELEPGRSAPTRNNDHGKPPPPLPSPVSSDSPEEPNGAASFDLDVPNFEGVDLDFDGVLLLQHNDFHVMNNVIREAPCEEEDLVGQVEEIVNCSADPKPREGMVNDFATPADEIALLHEANKKNFAQSPLHPSINRSQISHMGPGQYSPNKGPVIFSGDQTQIRATNSSFSDHINLVEHFLRQKWQGNSDLVKRDECLSNSVAFMISIFVSTSWTPMTAFYNYTNCHYQVNKLTTWRLNPTTKSYTELAPCYRPTRLQLTVPHPSIIDWTPFSAPRDRLILYHASNPQLDDIICEIGNSYVIETDISKLIAGVGSLVGYISVWDLVRAISPDMTKGDEESSCWESTLHSSALEDECRRSSVDDLSFLSSAPAALPAPSTNALFTSKTLALQAFNLLGMNTGTTYFRIDPAFFERHPELYDGQADMIAHGISIRPLSRQPIPAPKPIDTSILKRYGEMTTWTFGMGLGDRVGPEAVGTC